MTKPTHPTHVVPIWVTREGARVINYHVTWYNLADKRCMVIFKRKDLADAWASAVREGAHQDWSPDKRHTDDTEA